MACNTKTTTKQTDIQIHPHAFTRSHSFALTSAFTRTRIRIHIHNRIRTIHTLEHAKKPNGKLIKLCCASKMRA